MRLTHMLDRAPHDLGFFLVAGMPAAAGHQRAAVKFLHFLSPSLIDVVKNNNTRGGKLLQRGCGSQPPGDRPSAVASNIMPVSACMSSKYIHNSESLMPGRRSPETSPGP